MREDHELYRKLEQIAEPICRARGLAVADIRFHYEHGQILRVMIERQVSKSPGSTVSHQPGVSLTDCQEVTRDLLTALELDDELKLRGEYRLEVSSPGLDRPLYKLEDFNRFRGSEVRIQTRNPVAGRKRFRGKLVETRGENIDIEEDGTVVSIPFPIINKANLIPEL